MSSTGDALNRYLSTVRRIEEHREQSAVKDLKKLYRQLMKEIGERVAESYARYADPETGAIDYAVLHRDGMDARLLEEIMRSTGIASLEESRIIEQLAKESYAKCYDGMVSAVQRAATDDALQESLQTIRAVAPEVIAEAVHNPVNGLTLADRLEKKRGEIIYGIKQSVGVGLSQGDRYDTMTRRIAETLAGADGAGGYYGKAVRIARTEAHRVREAGNSDAAAALQEKAAPAGYQMLKRWNTMKDERVRPNRRYKTKHGWKSGKPGFYNHAAMEGVEIPLNEDFKLPSGASGPAPGQTNVAGEDINCRCFLTYRMEKTTRESWQKSFEAGAQKYRRLDREEGEVYTQRSAKNPNWEKWVVTDRIVTYTSPVYVSERVSIKPKELHIFYQDTRKAMQMFGVPLTEMPTLIIVAVDELYDAAGAYDSVDNTVKYIWDRDNVSPEERLGVIIHEMWHRRQAYDAVREGWTITRENESAYIAWLAEKCRKRMESLGVTDAKQAAKISDYARRMSLARRFDEVEAEFEMKNALESAAMQRRIKRERRFE